jgi:hypothetical protein
MSRLTDERERVSGTEADSMKRRGISGIRHSRMPGREQVSAKNPDRRQLCTACAVAALAMAYWPASAGNIPTKISVPPVHVTSESDVSNRIHKADRLSSLSFEERWSAVPKPSAEAGSDRNRRETPRAERRERIPFSCELAFSRLVTKGNFSTRCIAGLENPKTNT